MRLPLCLVGASLCACSASRTIYEDEGSPGNLAPVLDGAPDGDGTQPDGGADGASGDGLSCPPLPVGRPLMPDLATGWAASQGSTTLLQFGNHAFACGHPVDDAFSSADACPQLWAFEITVPDGVLVPGDVELTADHDATLVQFERSTDGLGCARDTIHSSSHGFRGTLRIHAVDDECIVGEFIDLTFPTDDLTGLSGVFAAERC